MTVTLGPVSAALETDLRSCVRRQGIVLWLDADDHYSTFVDRLIQLRKADKLPYAVHAFRGSHLELMLDLETLAGGVDRTQLVIHLPGFNELAVRTTPPLLELYDAGVRYRKALATLVTEAAAGRVPPDRIAAFCTQTPLALDAADTWLAGLLADGLGGLAGQLRGMDLTALVGDLLSGGNVATQLKESGEYAPLWQHFSETIGLPDAWRELRLPFVSKWLKSCSSRLPTRERPSPT